MFNLAKPVQQILDTPAGTNTLDKNEDSCEILSCFLANGYANSIKKREGILRSPSMSEVISGIIAADQIQWEISYLLKC